MWFLLYCLKDLSWRGYLCQNKVSKHSLFQFCSHTLNIWADWNEAKPVSSFRQANWSHHITHMAFSSHCNLYPTHSFNHGTYVASALLTPLLHASISKASAPHQHPPAGCREVRGRSPFPAALISALPFGEWWGQNLDTKYNVKCY